MASLPRKTSTRKTRPLLKSVRATQMVRAMLRTKYAA